MQHIEQYQEVFINYLKAYNLDKEPSNLYKPVNYILNLGGKRLRPVLTLMASDIFDGKVNTALNAALAVEVFHNFTLIHDDIMDDAPLRRGKATVHEKWDINTGILSGDAMLILAYQLFEHYPPETYKALMTVFSQTALEVCEGQQYDIDFETRNDVTIPEYLKMIEYKTAVLVAAAMKMGAIVAKASKAEQEAIYKFGKYLGIAFQLQDDYLDAFGNPETFGKQVGGDIIENKKTFLYLKTLELGNDDDRRKLIEFTNSTSLNEPEKVTQVKLLFEKTNAATTTKKEIERYTAKAFDALNALNISEKKKDILRAFGQQLMNRNM
ncbi:MAG: polyprenyl synthetase family protein [Winogradskyella sp.]|nr:polyprenyl synthetase family protein [Winogradskyella sp.]NNF85351.1 polyprenyl synthetase family protein [Winogradskyella sp.]